MVVFQGRSFSTEPEAAVAEATATWQGASPDLVVVFASTKQAPEGVYAALQAKYPQAVIVGASSTGEYLNGEHSNGAVVIAGLVTPHIRWEAATIPSLSTFQDSDARAAVDALLAAHGASRDALDPQSFVAVFFADGLSRKEEVVVAAVAEALDGIQVVGGSAGDDLAFKATQVFGPSGVSSDAAVLLLAHGKPGFFRLLKHQHFTTRPIQLAVTKADPATRTVFELDGYPAADAYAWALGLTRADLTQDVTFLNPVTVTVQGQIYVRSFLQVGEDGSLTFYCAVEEGSVLEIAGHHDMVQSLQGDFRQIASSEKVPFLIGFNCILRSLEAQKRGIYEALGCIYQDTADASIGFDTYGEQYNGLHINQTVVALALWPESHAA